MKIEGKICDSIIFVILLINFINGQDVSVRLKQGTLVGVSLILNIFKIIK